MTANPDTTNTPTALERLRAAAAAKYPDGPTPVRPAAPTAPTTPAGTATTRYGLAALSDEAATIRNAPEGERNATLNTAAFSIAQLVAGGEIDGPQAWEQLAAAARHTGLDEREITKTLGSAFKGGTQNPRGAPAPHVVTLPHPTADNAPTTDEHGATWRDVPLADIVAAVTAGTYTRPAPQIGTIDGAGALLYPGKVHLLFGIGGAAKTWIAAHCLAEQILTGRHVVFVDLEDNPETLIERLTLDLNVPANAVSDLLHYKRPFEPSHMGRDELLATINRYDPALVVIDSLGEALAADGRNPNADEEVAAWGHMIARPAARAGAAVLMIDHVPKADHTALTPIGSQRKQAAVDGATYAAQIVRAPAKGHAGHIKLVCGKDRQGTYGRGQTVAEFHMTPNGNRTRLELRAPEATPISSDGTFRPTFLMERVSTYVQANPGATRNTIVTGVPGKKEYVVTALDLLVGEGFVAREDGPNRSHLHTSQRPYFEASDLGTHPVPENGLSGSGSLRGGPGDPPKTVGPGPTGDPLGTHPSDTPKLCAQVGCREYLIGRDRDTGHTQCPQHRTTNERNQP